MFKLTIIILIIILLIYIESKNLKLTTYAIKSDKLPAEFKNTKLLILSDLHNNIFGNNNKRLITEIEKNNPDYILIAGDMLTSKKTSDYTQTLNLLEHLSKKYPIYYGMGNHEQRLKIFPEKFGDMYENYADKLKSWGIKLLSNETAYIEKKDSKIAITGIEIDYDYYERIDDIHMDYQYMENTIGKVDKTLYNILIAHNPLYFKQYAKWGADLITSGHMHGGVMILPNLGGVISPQFKLFPKYYGGLFQKDNSTMLVSCGLGMHTIKVRIFNRPELILVTLNC